MSKSIYKKLLGARSIDLSRYEMPKFLAKELDAVLILPHPEREVRFVNWCQSLKHFDGAFNSLKLDQVVYN